MIGGHAPTSAALAVKPTSAPVFIDAPPLAPEELPVELVAAGGSETVLRLVEAIVAEKTGYPAEMIGQTWTSSRNSASTRSSSVEILSAVRDRMPGLLEIEPSALARFRTIAAIATMIGGHAPENGSGSAPVAVTATATATASWRKSPWRLRPRAAARRSFAWSRRSCRRRPATRPKCSATTWTSRPNSASTSSSRWNTRCASRPYAWPPGDRTVGTGPSSAPSPPSRR